MAAIVNRYEVLGVGRDASSAELRRAYRALASLHHPDRNRGDVEAATARMAKINEAYETLQDPIRKYDHDRALARQQPSAKQEPRAPKEARPQRAPAWRPPPADDALRRARREAKERAAAQAKARGYSDPSGGYFDGMR